MRKLRLRDGAELSSMDVAGLSRDVYKCGIIAGGSSCDLHVTVL